MMVTRSPCWSRVYPCEMIEAPPRSTDSTSTSKGSLRSRSAVPSRSGFRTWAELDDVAFDVQCRRRVR